MTTAATERADARRASPWLRCPNCHDLVFEKRFTRNLKVCPGCGHHARLSAPERIDQLFDAGSVRPIPVRSTLHDPLRFVDSRPYADRLEEARRSTGLDEAVVVAHAAVGGRPLVAAVMDFRFLGGSLGVAVGERIARAAGAALERRVPLLIVTASGGARMQEGALSLMQMAKTAQALAMLDEAGIMTVSLITDPTYGGVAASYATLTDVIIAEPGARMGFAGPRVIEQTIRQRLPAGFQTAESLLAGGLIDDVRPRAALHATLAHLLAPDEADAAAGRPAEAAAPLVRDHGLLPDRDPWQAVQLARAPGRPTTLDYIGYMAEGFLELHGDRAGGDCPAIVGGIARIDGRRVMIIGHEKGHDTASLVARNFGMPNPSGYRKTARLMRLAEKLRIPVVTLIDTPGAYPGIEAEERGQAVAIAENLRLMSGLQTPIVAVVTGEGGSGGALALGVADRVFAMANAVYSVISPEGCAAILWKSQDAAPAAANALRMDTRELLRHSVIDAVIPEPRDGIDRDPATAAERLRRAVVTALRELCAIDRTRLVRERQNRFRRFGIQT